MGKNQMRYILSNNIPKLRIEKGLSQEALANALGVTRVTVNAIEKQNYNPSLDLAFRIAVYFNKSIEQIFNIEGENE